MQDGSICSLDLHSPHTKQVRADDICLFTPAAWNVATPPTSNTHAVALTCCTVRSCARRQTCAHPGNPGRPGREVGGTHRKSWRVYIQTIPSGTKPGCCCGLLCEWETSQQDFKSQAIRGLLVQVVLCYYKLIIKRKMKITAWLCQ